MRFFLSILFAALSTLRALAADDYLPLGLGMVWKMKAVYIPVGGEPSHGSVVQTIEERVERNGLTYFRAQTVSEGLPIELDNTRLFRKDEKGYYSMESLQGAAEVKDLVLPLKIGATWVRNEGGKVLTTAVIGLENLEVEGKTYPDCYHIRLTSVNGDYAEDVWDAPNIGFVKMIKSCRTARLLPSRRPNFRPPREALQGRRSKAGASVSPESATSNVPMTPVAANGTATRAPVVML